MKSLMIRNELDIFELKMCDIQGRLFELAWDTGYDSLKFIETFMKSEIASHLDMNYSFYQWAGEEYLLDELAETSELTESKKFTGAAHDREVMYWTGYIYRFWHYYTGEASKAICRFAPPQIVTGNYLMLHTMAPELAVETLKEIDESCSGQIPQAACPLDHNKQSHRVRHPGR